MHLAATSQNLMIALCAVRKPLYYTTIPALDAVHIASAETAQVDFFITCDYTGAQALSGNTAIITPLHNFWQPMKTSLAKHATQALQTSLIQMRLWYC